jgi:hypothetical protein
MERLTLRAFVVGGALLAAGMFIQLTPAVTLTSRTEEFMEQKAPLQVGDYKFVPDPMREKPNQSYVISPETYETLKPFGIVARVYTRGSEAYEVLLIASNDKNSFHDQRVCFSAQGYTLTSETTETMQTKRGPVSFTLVKMTGKERGDQLAAYFYKGPHNRFYAAPGQLTWAMFVEQFLSGTDLECVFYRFIPMRAETTKEELMRFMGSYLEEAEKSSEGYF